MQKNLISAALLAVSLGSAGAVRAQTLPDSTIHIGSRIRVQSSLFGRKPRVGTFVRFAGDSLSFVREGETVPMSIPIAQVNALDISVGRTAATRKGTHFGEIIGAAAGGAIGYAAAGGDNKLRTILGIGGAVGGFFLGHLYGAATGSSSSDEWVPVTVPARATR